MQVVECTMYVIRKIMLILENRKKYRLLKGNYLFRPKLFHNIMMPLFSIPNFLFAD